MEFKNLTKKIIMTLRGKGLGRFYKYGMVGLSGVFVQIGVMFILREVFHFDLTISAIISVELAITNNFLWNDSWTFQDISIQQHGWKARINRFSKFNTICVLGALLNVCTINVLVKLGNINEYLATILAIAIVTIWNFTLNFKFNWQTTPEIPQSVLYSSKQ